MPHTLASSACFAAAAPTAPADAGRGWASLILQELGRTQATGFLSDLIFWTLLGALTGALIAALAGWGFARLGWYEIPWRAGPPETISRSELSAFLVREALVPGALQPIRSTARAQQIPLIIVTALILCVPPWCIRTVANRGQRSPAPPQPPALPAR